MTTLAHERIDNRDTNMPIAPSPSGGSADASDGDRVVLTRSRDFVPTPDWDVVDAASRDSFPASDPPSWWAGGLRA
jgi:hypothetical protein